MKKMFSDNSGFTLIELILVIVIIGILAAASVNTLKPVTTSIKEEATKSELHELAFAIVGNASLESNGVRTDFGYVGDVGSFPPNLDALVSNPGGYSTWNGPYVKSDLIQNSNDYKTDSWGNAYEYTGGLTIRSTGSGSDIVQRLGNNSAEFLFNSISGTIKDANGSYPGYAYRDSLSVRIIYPDGAGSLTSSISSVGADGFFTFDSIPVGNHDIETVYIPANDTISRTITVTVGSDPNTNIKLVGDFWNVSTSGGLTLISNSDSVYNSPQCHNLSFSIENNTGSAILISNITVTWSSPVAYYKSVSWNGAMVVNNPSPSIASGITANFSATQSIADGERVQMSITSFKSNTSGGSNVNVENIDFTVSFSDGSSLSFNSGTCQ